MAHDLTIRGDGALDFLSLGALVHRLDPGVVPFRKASSCAIHVSGGEFNVAANLADCFRLRTGVATAMVDYPIGDLIAERVRAMGVIAHSTSGSRTTGSTGPNMATVYSDRGFGVRPPVVFYNRAQRGRRAAQAGRLRLAGHLRGRRALVPQRRHLRVALRDDRRADHRGDEGRESRRRRHVVRPELPREALEHLGRSPPARPASSGASSSTWTCSSATKRTCRRASASPVRTCTPPRSSTRPCSSR